MIDASGSYVTSTSDQTNTGFTDFPKYILNLGVGYTATGNWQLYVNNRVHLDTDDGPQRATITPNKLKDYWRTDLHASRRGKKNWNVFFNVRNLFNRENHLPSLVNTEGGIQDDKFSVDAGIRYTLQ